MAAFDKIQEAVFKFLVNEGYHNHYPTAQKAADRLATILVNEVISDELDDAWRYSGLCE